MNSIIYLVPLFPLIGFLLNGLLRNHLSKPAIGMIGSGAILGSFVVSIMLFQQVAAGTTSVVTLFNFIQTDQFTIPFSFQIDQLSAIFLLVITGVGFLIHVYSTAYMKEEIAPHFARYFAYLNLFVFSMLLLVMGSNFLIMFIGWEGVGLCSYLLIGYWFKNNDYNQAAKKAFVMNRIGDVGFLLALFYLIAKLGTLTFSEVFAQVGQLSDTDLTIITMLLFVGAMGKSAQIPLYTWLPDAMAGPTPVSALIHAATMVTAGIYMIARSNIMYTMAPVTSSVVAIIGLATALFAATIALKQNDIKKVLAYSTVSQLGYMFLGLGVGAYTGAVFHVMTHAFFKALLFLGAGSVIHAMHHQQNMQQYGGLRKFLPITHITMLIGCLAIAGIPPFSGFFSKDEILIAAYAHNPIFYYLGMGGALMTAFYMFRLYALTFRGSFRGGAHYTPHESPASMTLPLIVLAILAAGAGFLGIPALFSPDAHQLQQFLAPIFKDSMAHLTGHAHPSHETEWMLLAGSLTLIIITIIWAWSKYSKKQPEPTPSTGFGKVLENKWYVDELYQNVITKPLFGLAKFLSNVVERYVVDGLVNGVGRAVQYGGRQFRYLQSGQVGSYILLMVLSMLAFFIIQFFIKK